MNGKRIFLSALAAFLCTLAASCRGGTMDEVPYGLSLEAWPLRLEAGGTALVTARFRDRSPSLPQFSWITDYGSILKGSVANEVAFQAPRQPRTCTLSVEVKIEGRVFKDSVFFTVTLPGGILPGADPATAASTGLSAAATDPSILFSDRSPLYASPLWPGPRDALNLKLRVRADLDGDAWILVVPDGGQARRSPMAPLGSDGDFRWYGAQVQGADAPAEYWFEFTDRTESIYCSIRGAEPLPPPPSRRFRLLPPATSSEPLPEESGRAMLRAIVDFLGSTDSPRLRGDAKALSSSLVSAASAIPQNRLLEPLGAFSVQALLSSLQPTDASSASQAITSAALVLSAILPGGLREAAPEACDPSDGRLLDRLAELRNALSSLRRGSWLCLPIAEASAFSMARWDESSRVLAIARPEGAGGLITIPVGALGLGEGQRLKAALGSGPSAILEGQQFQVRSGSVALSMEGPSVLVLVAQGADEPPPSPPIKPRVTSILPANGAKMIPQDGRIVIQFSDAMDQAGIGRAFSMSPPADGTFFWNGRTCIFVPSQELERATRYGISIDGTYGSRLGGYRLAESLSFSFTTR